MQLRPLLAVTVGAAVLLTGCRTEREVAKDPMTTGTSASASPSPSASASPSASPSSTASPDARVTALLTKSRDAYLAAPLTRAVGSASGGGSTLTLDVLNDRSGNGSGTIGVGKGTAKLIRVGATLYILGDQLFWIQNGGAQIHQRLGGKWMQVAAKSNFQDLQGFFDREAMAGTVFAPSGTPTLTAGPDGSTWLVSDGTGTLTIDKTTSLPLKLDGEDASGSFRMTFTYPTQGSIQAPPKDQVAPPQ